MFFGLSGAQIVGVVLSLSPLLFGVNQKNPAWLGLGAVFFAIAVFLIVVPIRGRSALGWLGAVVLFGVGIVFKWTLWRSDAARGEFNERIDMPGVLSALEIHDGPLVGRSRVAIIQNHASRTWAATARLVHPGLAMADSMERALMGQGLVELLNAAGRGGLIDEVMFIVRTVPDDGAERQAYVRRHTNAGTPDVLRRISDDVAETVAAFGVRTEAFVTFTVTDEKLRKEAKEFASGFEGRVRAMRMIMDELEAKARNGMRMEQVDWLSSAELAEVWRTAFAPGDRAQLVMAQAEAEVNPKVRTGVEWPLAGPSQAGLAIRHYEHDAWWSASDTIRLPGTGGVLGALAPVLMPAERGERRCLMVSFPMMDLAKAQRKIRSAEATADMAEGVNEKLGRRVRAAEQNAMNRTRALDQKVTQGYSMIRPYAIATVTVPNSMPIAEFGRRLDSSIRSAGFSPLRLDLAQDVAFAASTVPVGITLRRGY
jgi:hypothetical protein